MKAKNILLAATKIGVTALLLYLVFRAVDLAQLRQDLAQLDTSLLFILLVIMWIGQLFCAQRWRLFAGAVGLRAGYKTFFQMYFAGMLFNIGLPSLVGGDVLKAYMISRKTGGPLRLGIASTLQDRAAGLISLLIIGNAAVLLRPLAWKGLPLWLAYLVVWFGVAAFLWAAWRGRSLYARIPVPESTPGIGKILELVGDLHQALVRMRLSAGSILQITLYSFLNSSLVFFIFHQVSTAAGHTVDPVAFSALLPLIILVTMLPISLGGVGIREWAYVEGLSLLGVPAHIALTIALTTSALLIVCDLAGLFFLPFIPRQLRAAGATGHRETA